MTTPKKATTPEDEMPMEEDIEMTMAAVGTRGELVSALSS